MKRETLRPLAILVAALAAIGVVAVATANTSNTDQNDPSSRSSGRLGTLALYTWLDDLGLQVHRISGSFDLSGTDVLVVYDPTVQVATADVASVVRFLKSGGDAIVVTDLASIGATQPLLQALSVQTDSPVAAGLSVPAQPYDATGRVRSVPVGAGYSFAALPPAVPLLTSGGDQVAAAVRVGGGGRAYVIGNTQPLSNDGLRHDDSGFFLLSLLQRARGGRIGFDEYHHGEGGQSVEGAAAIFNGPIGVAAVLATLITLAALAVNGRRLGRPVSGVDPTAVPSAAAYVRAVGRLFSRSKHREAVVARYADELKRRIGELTGVEAHLDDSTFVAAVQSADGSPRSGALSELLGRLRRLASAQPGEQDVLDAARDVDAFERAWLRGAELRP